MAEQGSGDKTEDATPKRIREARKKGQVAKSRDLVTVVVMIVVFGIIAGTAGFITHELKELMLLCFNLVSKDKLTGSDFFDTAKLALAIMAKVLAPIFIGGFVSALLVGFLQIGPLFSTEVLTPKFEKLNPIEGLKNMFKMVTFIELIKNIAKIILVFYLAYSTINARLEEVLLTTRIPLVDSVMITGEIVWSFFIKICIAFLIIALIDLAVQRWNFMKNMRMSKDEVKREYKEDEGDPHIKGERKRLHREMVFGDTKKNTKKADAVVKNPTHVAIAIEYKKDEMGAPEVVAKGQDEIAEVILEVAEEEGIPVIRNIPLAWALLKVEVGSAIPEDLYEPVAEVLSYVYELKENREAQNSQLTDSPHDKKSSFDPFKS